MGNGSGFVKNGPFKDWNTNVFFKFYFKFIFNT